MVCIIQHGHVRALLACGSDDHFGPGFMRHQYLLAHFGEANATGLSELVTISSSVFLDRVQRNVHRLELKVQQEWKSSREE